MEAQPGRTSRRRFLLIAGLPLLAAGGLTAYAAWPEPDRSKVRVRTDLKPLESRFGTYVGELTEAHWVGYDIDESPGDRTIPSPDSRIRLVGVARLAAGGAAAIVRNAEYAFTPAVPASALPAPLEKYSPADAAWQHSPQFDAYVNRPQSDGHPSGAYHLDEARDLVHFDLLYLYT
ncbi:hypothetical protein ACIPYQ_12740 [Streptomyces sp. NPDC090045]|uniref:hypothetical protein n=1 Tax=Streptomyces sp. NPDC090045 TaxID=3365927 RepID=UPI00382DDB10